MLSPWRLSTNEVLATQIEVFEESQAEDDENMTMPGGVDLNSHEDVFSALFTKVCNRRRYLSCKELWWNFRYHLWPFQLDLLLHCITPSLAAPSELTVCFHCVLNSCNPFQTEGVETRKKNIPMSCCLISLQFSMLATWVCRFEFCSYPGWCWPCFPSSPPMLPHHEHVETWLALPFLMFTAL